MRLFPKLFPFYAAVSIGFIVAKDEIITHGAKNSAESLVLNRAALGPVYQRKKNSRREPDFYLVGKSRSEANARWLTGKLRLTWHQRPHDEAAWCAERGLRWEGSLGFAAEHTIVQVPLEQTLTCRERLRREPAVASCEMILGKIRATRSVPNDTFFNRHWHLHNTAQPESGGIAGVDINVLPAWGTLTSTTNFTVTGVSGVGQRIAIVDDGVELTHRDLTVDTLTDHDWNDATVDDASPVSTHDNHGTAVAGIAAAKGNNGQLVCGVAPNATIVPQRLLGLDQNNVRIFTTDQDEAEAFFYLSATARPEMIPIKNNSWGIVSGLDYAYSGPDPLARAAQRYACMFGRSGRGTIFTFSAGNGRIYGQNTNRDGYANSIFSIAVGSINPLGQVATFSEPSACLAVVAPGQAVPSSPQSSSPDGIFTTDRSGSLGYNTFTNNTSLGDATRFFDGTSASCPMVSGVVALMLERRPDLGWRDVKEILMRTANRSKLNPNTTGWVTNGGGLSFHHDFGAGLVDAAAAVSLASTWTKLGPLVRRDVAAITAGPRQIPKWNGQGTRPASLTVNFTQTGLRCEQVMLRLSAENIARGTIDVRITSPFGTESVLTSLNQDNANRFESWPLTSVRHWGEMADGEWKIDILDTSTSSSVGTITEATLSVFGYSASLDSCLAWRTQHFPANVLSQPALEATVWGGTADPDGDGWPNHAENYFGTDPNTSDRPPIWSVETTPTQIVLRWKKQTACDLTILPQWSADLRRWHISGERVNGFARSITQSTTDDSIEEARLDRTGLTHAYLRLLIAPTVPSME